MTRPGIARKSRLPLRPPSSSKNAGVHSQQVLPIVSSHGAHSVYHRERSGPAAGTSVLPAFVGRSTTLVMAVACGVAPANIYYNQPILAIVEAAFARDVAIVSFVPSATQIGYAIGLLLLVPLGDRIARRRLILLQTATQVHALVGAAIAPSARTLIIGSALVGVTSTVAQQIVPFAAEITARERRGATVGIVMSGLLCGILFGRAAAGVVGDLYGWRAVFWLGAALSTATGLLLAVRLPRSSPKTQVGYVALLMSLVALWREEPVLRRATAIQGCLFGLVIVFWTILALQLEARYRLTAEVAGGFGVIGAVGILFAPLAGKIADRRGPHMVIGLGAVIMLASWVVFGAWRTIIGLVVGVVLLDFGEQGALVSNQHVIYTLRPEARSRSNTLFMGGMFIGGAIGSAGAMFVWRSGGWIAVCLLGAGLVAGAAMLHIRGRLEAARAREAI